MGVDSSTVRSSLTQRSRLRADARAYGTLTAASSAAASTNTDTIEAAIEAAAASDVKTVIIPAGTYYVDDLQITDAVTVQGPRRAPDRPGVHPTTGYGVTIRTPMPGPRPKILYAGSASPRAAATCSGKTGHCSTTWFPGLQHEQQGVSLHQPQRGSIGRLAVVNCIFGNPLARSWTAGAPDQLGLVADAGDGIITGLPVPRCGLCGPGDAHQGSPFTRILNPKFLGWSVACSSTGVNSPAARTGSISRAVPSRGSKFAGARVARSSGSNTLVDNLITGVEFVPGDHSGAACVDIQDGSARAGPSSEHVHAGSPSSSQHGVKLGSGATKVGIRRTSFRNAGTGVIR